MKVAFECVWSGIPEAPGIVFAPTRNRARYVTAWQARDAGYHDASYAEVTAKRRSDLDHLAALNDAPKGCTVERYLERPTPEGDRDVPKSDTKVRPGKHGTPTPEGE